MPSGKGSEESGEGIIEAALFAWLVTALKDDPSSRASCLCHDCSGAPRLPLPNSASLSLLQVLFPDALLQVNRLQTHLRLRSCFQETQHVT